MSNRAPITNTSKEEDFLLVCPSASGLAETIHALYYLPQNYRLVVLSQVAQDRDDMDWVADSMMERVQFEKTGLSNGASPFSSADAVISDDAMSNVADSTPMVVLSRYADDDSIETTGQNRFEVSADNPDALASAILNIAKGAKGALGTPSEIQQYA